MSKLFGVGQKAAYGGIQGDVLATDNNTVGMGDAGIKSAIQGSNVPNPDEAVPSFVSGAMAKAGKVLLEGTLQAGTSAVSFFFSSRRRHTRWNCDWSSDVCSSDLAARRASSRTVRCVRPRARTCPLDPGGGWPSRPRPAQRLRLRAVHRGPRRALRGQIGRASCRERV